MYKIKCGYSSFLKQNFYISFCSLKFDRHSNTNIKAHKDVEILLFIFFCKKIKYHNNNKNSGKHKYIGKRRSKDSPFGGVLLMRTIFKNMNIFWKYLRNANRNTKAREDVRLPPGSDSTARSPPPSVTITSHSMATKLERKILILFWTLCNWTKYKLILLFLGGDPIYVVPRKCNKFSPGLNFAQFSFD